MSPNRRDVSGMDGFISRKAPRENKQQINRSDTPIKASPLATTSTEPLAALPSDKTLSAKPPSLDTNRSAVTLALDMALPGEASMKPKSPILKVHRHSVRRWMVRAVVIILVLVLGFGGLLGLQGYNKLHKVFHGGAATASALQASVDVNSLKGEGAGRVNVLLLGIGGGDHDGPNLTDTIMVASIDPVNKTADLISVPRDLWVNVTGHGPMKLNAAFETGIYSYLHQIDNSNTNPAAVTAGFTSADQTVSQVLGIDIDYNVLVDFQAFQQAVDTVGGVTVNVPTELYDPTMAWENNHSPILAEAGVQQMSGAQALLYVRSRETSSDFARAARQRAVLLALKDKVVTLGTLSNPVKISQLLSAFGNNVQTDLSLSDANKLYNLMKGTTNTAIGSIGLADAPNDFVTTDHVGNQSVVRPTAGFNNYSAIQAYIRSVLPDGYIVKEHAKVMVLNGTSSPSLGMSTAAELKSYGYDVISVANAPTMNYTQTVLVDLTHGKDKYTDHYLSQRFGVTATSQIPDKTIQVGQADFILVLGTDETSSSQN